MKSKLRLLLALVLSVVPFVLGKHIYRLAWDASIGQRVRVRFGTLILADRIRLDDDTRIGFFNLIVASDLRMDRASAIGNFSRIFVNSYTSGPRSQIGSWVSIMADPRDKNSSFVMGNESWIFERCYLNVARPVRLGVNVGIGGGSYLFTHGYWLSQLEGFPVAYGAITIADDVWLPWGCFIMPGVKIGEKAVVGACSVVTKSVPPAALMAGVPAKLVKDKSYREVSSAGKIEMLRALTAEYAAYYAKTIDWRQTGEWMTCYLDGAARLAYPLHEDIAPQLDQGQDVLHLTFAPSAPDSSSISLCLSLVDYCCSPFDRLHGDHVAWLRFGRRIGLRAYPLDELGARDHYSIRTSSYSTASTPDPRSISKTRAPSDSEGSIGGLTDA